MQHLISWHTTIEAYKFAVKKHEGQYRDDGETPYTDHLEKVAQIIHSAGGGPVLVCAAFLHDTLEDTDTTYDDLVEKFGKEVADLVHEVTHEGDKKTGYYFPRLKSRGGIMLKFADRLANISDMESWSFERKNSYLKSSKFWKSEQPKTPST